MKCSIESCCLLIRSRGWCEKHYTRWLRHGDPLAVKNFSGLSLEDRFWCRVRKTEQCWEWIGFRDKCGYGVLNVGDCKIDRAHRVSWMLRFGLIPKGMHVLHRCDNPPCVRPAHLWLGTQNDNNEDRIAKGRTASKLTAKQVVDIRREYSGQRGEQLILSRKYRTTQRNISSIVRGFTWRNFNAKVGPISS